MIEAQCSEAMTVPLPETPGRALAAEGLEAVLGLAAERDAVAMGPGVGRRRETTELLRGLAARVDKPLVIDADGLAAFEGLLDTLKDRSAPTVLTPHPGGSGSSAGERSRRGHTEIGWGAARELEFLSGSVVLLKGAATVAASPDGRVIINPTGGPNLATRGKRGCFDRAGGGIGCSGLRRVGGRGGCGVRSRPGR